jgi:hypothetical protein
MAKCKFCGDPVDVAPVCHQECWEEKFESLAKRICDDYCKYPETYGDDGFEETLDTHCATCPLDALREAGW